MSEVMSKRAFASASPLTRRMPPYTGSDAVAGASVASGTVVSAPASVAVGAVASVPVVVSSTTVEAGESVSTASSSFLLQAPAMSPLTTKVVSSSRPERPRCGQDEWTWISPSSLVAPLPWDLPPARHRRFDHVSCPDRRQEPGARAIPGGSHRSGEFA
jgi:hypothetical protein